MNEKQKKLLRQWLMGYFVGGGEVTLKSSKEAAEKSKEIMSFIEEIKDVK